MLIMIVIMMMVMMMIMIMIMITMARVFSEPLGILGLGARGGRC